MSETCEVQAWEKISTEVDEAQIKVIFTTQCIKAQTYLVNKLKKQAEHSRETCSYISSANFKLQTEITQAEQVVQSLLVAQETVKMSNVELKKEWLIAKEKKLDVIERVKDGEKKYEDLWLESKARYESLPFVQKLLKAKDDLENIKQSIIILENDEKILIHEIRVKQDECLNLDRKRIIEIAQFMVNEVPKSIDIISTKTAAIKQLTNELENLKHKAENNVVIKETIPPEETKEDSKTNEDWFSDMPKLQLSSLDLDMFSIKLEQVKLKKTEPNNSLTHSDIDMVPVYSKTPKNDEFISSYFSKPTLVYEENKNQNYAKMKLINILEDVKIDKKEALNIIVKVRPESLHPVESISIDDKNTSHSINQVTMNKEEESGVEEEKIEEIDLTYSNTENLLIPPTQFLDTASTVQNSQEEHPKKKVSFDLPNTHTSEDINAEKSMIQEIDLNETPVSCSQLDVSAVSEEGFAKMKDMIIKKHNLELSPQFVYSKNTITPLNLQKQSEDAIIISKFFQHNKIFDIEANITNEATDIEMVNEDIITTDAKEVKNNYTALKDNNIQIVETDIEADMISSPKKQKVNEITVLEKNISGPFGHVAHNMSEILNASISTMGFEDGDADFPHCIDSSLLLSPKADVPACESGDPEVLSQDVPNFLSGLRKTGMSFFQSMTSSGPKPDSSAQSQGGFNFNFKTEEKKTRGGLFNMFQ